MKETKIKKWVGYVRISSDSQMENTSISEQVRQIEAFCVSQGWQLAAIFKDEGVSGSTIERDGYQEMLHYIQQPEHEVGGIVVTKSDRIHRQSNHLLDLIEEELEPSGMAFISVTERMDTSTPQGKIFLQMLGLAFWHKYPSPYLLKGETVEALAHFLRLTSNNACSTRKAEQLLAWIQADGDTTRTYQEQRDFLIRSHVRDIRFNKKEIARVEGELHRMMKQLDLQLETMPGIDLVTSSALVAEIGDVHRFASADKLARFAGIAPVKMGSGGKHVNLKSRQGNRVLHGLFYNLAVQQVQVSKGSQKPRNPLFYEYFNRKKEEEYSGTRCQDRFLIDFKG